MRFGREVQQLSSSLPDTVDAKLLLACSGADAQTLQRDRDRNAEMTLTQLTEEGVPFVINAKIVRDSGRQLLSTASFGEARFWALAPYGKIV